MKLFAPALFAMGLVALALPVLVVSVVATHPWLAVGAFLAPVEIRDDRTTAGPFPTTTPVPAASSDVLEVARSWLNPPVPYVFGGCSRRGVDCSCLVMLVFRAVGVSLPRTAAEQYAATARIADRDLQPGDLVFFANTYMPGISHVGIYIGGGLLINAPTEGQVVSVEPVFSAYWGAHYAGAGRVRR
jgi:cell wall-associated NlpC family hydrolase